MPSETPDEQFGRLVRRQEPRLRAYLARRLPADAVDDVLADVLLVAWRRRDEMPAEALPWLLVVANKTLSTRWRGEARREALVELVARQPVRGAASIEADLERQAQQRALAAALGALADHDRELVLLRFWDELRPRHIATVLGLPAITVRARLRRATLRLHRRLREELDRAAAVEEPESLDGPSTQPMTAL